MNLPEEYRPCDWSEVMGQDKVIAKIDRLRKRGLAGRGYWISGQSGTGKTTIARLIATEVASEWSTEELAWIPTGSHEPNRRADFDVLVNGRNVSCWVNPTERPFAQPKTNCSRLRPSQGIRISLRSKPAATSSGLCARF